MAFLTIGAIADIAVLGDGAAQNEGVRIGERIRAFDGTLRSTVRAMKREWSFTALLVTQAEETALRAAVANDQPVTCTGDALLGATVTCVVTITSAPYQMLGVSFYRTAVLALTEI